MIVAATEASVGIADALPPAVAALLLRASRLGKSRLELMEFQDIETMQIVARKITKEYGDSTNPFLPFS
jgi:hypothetical protein